MPIDATTVVTTAVTTILMGGLLTGIGAVWNARSNARKVLSDIQTLGRSTPLDLSDKALKGSEDAMLIMQSANDRLLLELERQRVQLERKDEENARLHQRVDQLEKRLEKAQQALLAAHELSGKLAGALHDLQEGYDVIRRELADMRKP